MGLELDWTVLRLDSHRCVYMHIEMVHGSLLQGERLLYTCASANESGAAPADCLGSYIFLDDVYVLNGVRKEERKVFC